MTLDDHVYSNFDHVLNEEVVAYLVAHPGTRAKHTAWEFFATVWFDGSRWFSEVKRYRVVVDIFSGATIRDVIKLAIDKWGNE